MQPLVISQVFSTMERCSVIKMLWCFLQGLDFFGESHLAKAGGWVKNQLVCNHLLLNHIHYTENFIPVSFLITCKEASRDFYCSAHWFLIGTLNMYRGDQNKQTRYNWTHCSTPVTMMWKQWCQAPKQQGCNSKKLGSYKEPRLCRASWLWHYRALVKWSSFQFSG